MNWTDKLEGKLGRICWWTIDHPILSLIVLALIFVVCSAWNAWYDNNHEGEMP